MAGGAAAAVVLTLPGKLAGLGDVAGPGLVRRLALTATMEPLIVDPFYPYRVFGETHADFLRRAFRSAKSIEIIGTRV